MALTLGTSRSNVLAIKKETTEGTIVEPSAGTDYVALQTDATLTPSFEVLESSEIRASIAPGKPVQGREQPQASFSHYMKHSGTEGSAPEIGDILESLFGSTSSNATERATTSGSTVSVISLASGGGDFARGKAVLLKDGANGYRIRPVHSVSTNDLTLGFQLPTGAAPASGVNAGKCVNYSPANSGHPALSMWMYRGNGHAIEAIAGAKCTGLTINSPGSQMINGNFSFQGSKYFFNPIEITSSNKYIDVSDDGSTEENISIAEKYYRDPYELAQALEDALNASALADNYTVTYNSKGSDKGKFTLTSDGSTFEINWNSGTNTANSIGTTLGFSVGADDTGALTYTSDNVLNWAAPHTPTYDSTDPVVAKNQEVLLGDADDYECFEAGNITVTIPNTNENVLSICSESGVNSNLITGRAVTVQIQALLDKHEAENFKRFRANDTTRFCYNFGVKSGGNWVAGTCASIYIPTAVISSFALVDVNSVIALDMTLIAFADENGNGEVYLNFL